MATAEDDQSTASLDSQRQGPTVAIASHTMLLHAHDHEVLDAGGRASKHFDQVDLSGQMQSADALFRCIMDPKNEEVKKIIKDFMHGPMTQIYEKAMEMVRSIETSDSMDVIKEKLDKAEELMKRSEQCREQALDHVYKAMERQVDNFEISIDKYNQKMEETFKVALKIYEEGVDSVIRTRAKLLKQKKEEHDTMVQCADAESTQEHNSQMKRLSFQQNCDEHAARQADKALERQLKKDERDRIKAQQDMEREQKKLDMQLDRDARKANVEHDKAMKELEARARTAKITQEERQVLAQELAAEVARYKTDFALAAQAMHAAIAQGKTCYIKHNAPTIDWGKPPREPPRVVPGHVTWEFR